MNRRDDGFVARPVKIELDTREQVAHGEIRSSFWGAAVEAGMTEDQIMDLAAIFGWDIDFAQDLQPGTASGWSTRTNTRMTSGCLRRHPGRRVRQPGAIYRAVLNTDGNYYTPDGKAMRKSFLRAPVNFKYISSNFNPAPPSPGHRQGAPPQRYRLRSAGGHPIMAAGGGSGGRRL